MDVPSYRKGEVVPGEAIKWKEGWRPGKVTEYDSNGRQINKPLPGSKSIEDFEEDHYEDPGFTMSP